MRSPSILAFTLAMPAVLLLITASALAQDPSGVFGESIEVRVVNLEVVVTDRAGHRVSGLQAEDFELKVDGKALPIDYFTEVADGRRAEPREAPGGALPVPGVAVGPGEAVGTSYLVFIDDLFTVASARRNQVLMGIIEHLARLGPEDRMAVVAFNGKKPEMLSSWSNSREQLREALETAKQVRARGLHTDTLVGFTDRQNLLAGEDSGGVDGGTLGGGALTSDGTAAAASREAQACAAIRRIEFQLERVVMAVGATLRGFSRPPGRKVMLLLSGGWPNSAYDYVLGATSPFDRTGQCGHKGPKILRPIYDTANRLGYTLYPIDVPGRRSSPTGAQVVGEAALGRIDSSLGIPAEFIREDELHTTLYRLAGETGGQPLVDGARLDVFNSVVDDTRSYYWLGFTPDWQGDDRTHDIRLDVKQRGLKVRYREGFRDLSRSAEVDFMVESTLLFGELPGALPLHMELGRVPPGRRKFDLPVLLKIPMDEITMIPHRKRYVAELELRVGAIDGDGHRNEISKVPVTLAGDDPPPAGAYATYEFAVKIRREPQDLVVTLYDPVGDKMLTALSKLEL